MPTNDPLDHPEVRAWLDHAEQHTLPKILESAATIQIAPDELDPKSAIELGYSLLLDKPLIIVVPPGRSVPEHLVPAGDAIVEWPDDGNIQDRLLPGLVRLGLIEVDRG
jgi:hypothetical protein